MDVRVRCRTGSFNLMQPGEREMSVNLSVDGEHVLWEVWPEDDAPDVASCPPSEIVELIAGRVEAAWIRTSREKDRATVAWYREHAEEVDSAWADAEAGRMEKRAALLLQDAARLRHVYVIEAAPVAEQAMPS